MSDTPDFFGFGAGDAFLVPNTGSDLTPVRFNLQDFSFDIKFDTKTLHGRKAMPLKVARGKGTITGKFKNATVNGAALNRCFFGDAVTTTTGQLSTVVSEVLVFASGNTAVAANAGSGGFRMDLGAIRVDTAQPLTKDNAAPGTETDPVAGHYYVDPTTGTYHVNAADKAGGVVVSYTYMASTGLTSTISNRPMGSGPSSKLVYATSFEGRQFTLQLNMVQLVDLKMAVKNDDFLIPEQSFNAFADITDTVGLISLGV